MDQAAATERVRTYCALCIARCGAVAVVQDGRLAALEPDPSHPTGQALCAKGRAAPELVHHRDRLTHPLRRTRPKGDPDPGGTPVLYWFKLVRDPGKSGAAAVTYVPHRIDDASGVGTQFAIGDLDGDRRVDIVIGNKKGGFVFRQAARP